MSALPNLFVIGAAKAGTTAIHHFLPQRPDAFMSRLKEPNHFSFPEGVPRFAGPAIVPRNSFERDRLRRERYELSVVSRTEYERLFAPGRGRPVRGESPPAYLYLPAAAASIKAAVPAARIVVVLRDPVDRAYSKYLQMRRDGMEPLEDFAEAVAAEPQRLKDGWSPTWLYIDRGYYHRQLAPYLALIDRRQIHVLLYDDLQRDPAGSVRSILDFLGVDSRIKLDTSERHNVSAEFLIPRCGQLYEWTVRPYLSSARLQRLLPEAVARHLRLWARRLLLKRAAAPSAPALNPALKKTLVVRFRRDAERLAELIDRDLSHWQASAG